MESGGRIRARRWPILVLVLAACASSTTRPKEPEKTLAIDTASEREKSLLTPSALGEVTRGFADQYVTTIAGACEAIIRDNKDAGQRRVASQLRSNSTLAAYDIVTNVDPYTQLLDLVVLVSLQCSIWIDDDRAEEFFGDKATSLIGPLRILRERAWSGAARALKPEQLQVLDWLIFDFRRRRPELGYAEMIRFAEFAESRAKSEIDGLRAGGGLLAPVKEAQQTAEQLRQLGERVFYLAKRLPILLAFYTDARIDQILAKPEVSRVIAIQENLVETIGHTTDVVAAIPAQITMERKAILAAVEDTSSRLHETVEATERIISETKGLTTDIAKLIEKSETMVRETGNTSRAVTETLGAVERLMRILRIGEETEDRLAGAEPAKPFDIQEYTKAIVELATTVNETTDLILSTEKLLTADAWTKRLGEIRETATGGVGDVTKRAEAIFDMLFLRALALLLILFSLMAGYRYYLVRLKRSGAA